MVERRGACDLKTGRGIVVGILAAFGIYMVGFASGVLKWPPYSQLRALRHQFNHNETGPQEPRDDAITVKTALFDRAFSDPLAPGVTQRLPACSTVDDVRARLSGLEIDYARFFTAYDDLELDRVTKTRDILEIEYHLGSDRNAFAYFGKSRSLKSENCAVLLIPGTGINQSSEIVSGNAKNYHGMIYQLLVSQSDTFVLVKPNEDFLAIQNGARKLNANFVHANLLNRGGSYSANYLIHALAIAKHLKAEYERIVVLGLSQGGTAALLVALQAEPNGAVIASGYSVLNDAFLGASIEQIIIPTLGTHLKADRLRTKISTLKTRFLFTFGRSEPDIYGLEAQEGRTASAFKNLPNVQVCVHKGGHVFDGDSLKIFLAQTLFAKVDAPQAGKGRGGEETGTTSLRRYYATVGSLVRQGEGSGDSYRPSRRWRHW